MLAQDEKRHKEMKEAWDYWVNILMPTDWYGEVFDSIRSKGAIPFSMPVGRKWVEFLNDLNVDLFKVASSELVDHYFVF